MQANSIIYLKTLTLTVAVILFAEALFIIFHGDIQYSLFYPASTIIAAITTWSCSLIDKKAELISSISSGFVIKLLVYAGLVIYCHHTKFAPVIIYGSHIVILYIIFLFVDMRHKLRIIKRERAKRHSPLK